MDKSFLHFIWEREYFNEHELCSQKGQPVTIISPGKRNLGPGPDFLDARVKVGDVIRIGGILINLDGSDWFTAERRHDPDFSNIALHVTYRNIPSGANNQSIPILELSGKISQQFLDNFHRFQTPVTMISCAEHLRHIKASVVLDWRDELIHEILESSRGEIETILEFHDWDWDRTFLHFLVRNFDTQVNQNGFHALSDILDYSLLLKLKDDITLLEAMLLGQSGMLQGDTPDDYTHLLQGAFGTIEDEFEIEILDKQIWRAEGLRPVQAPAVKIAQLASVIHRFTPLFSSFQERYDPGDLLRSVSPSKYWSNHTAPGVPCNKFKSQISGSFAAQLITSSYVPVLFTLGKATSVPEIEIQAIEHLDNLPAQKSRKTNLMESVGLLPCRNAGDSMAIEYGMERYCMQKKCLQCPLGCSVLGLKKGSGNQKEFTSQSYIYN